jgi:hypothetical protein
VYDFLLVLLLFKSPTCHDKLCRCAKSATNTGFSLFIVSVERETHVIKNDLRASLKRQTIAVAISLVLCTIFGSSAQAKGLFGSEDKDANSPQTLQAQLYQIQQQLTQLQAQMTQLQLQMNKRTTVIEQKQNSLHETLSAQAAVLKTLAREEQQIEHQVAQQGQRQAEPVAVKTPPARVQQPTLEESADYEVAHVNTKATPAYKSHIQDLDAEQLAAPAKKPTAIAAKPTPNTVTESKAETKKEKKEKKEREAKSEDKSSDDKNEGKTSRLLPGVFSDRISKVKKESAAQQEKQSTAQTVQAETPKPNLNSGKSRVKASIVIKAPPDVVFNAVHEQRKVDPELAYSKVMRQGVNESQLEQKFTALPMIGSATCLINTQEIPNRRIDYQMVKSDKFKSMEGSWVLTPSADGKSTTLELSSHIDTGLPVPKMMMNGITQKKMERRLAHVRELAEKNRLAQRSGAGAQ